MNIDFSAGFDKKPWHSKNQCRSVGVMMDIRSFNNVLKGLNTYTNFERREAYKFEAVVKADGKVALVTFDENRNVKMLLATRNTEQLVLALYTKMNLSINGKIYRTLVEALGIIASNPVLLRRDCLMEQVLDLECLELQLENIVWIIKARK